LSAINLYALDTGKWFTLLYWAIITRADDG